jgi:HYR domain
MQQKEEKEVWQRTKQKKQLFSTRSPLSMSLALLFTGLILMIATTISAPMVVVYAANIEDTIPPILTVPEGIVVEATSEQVAQVTFTVTAQDDVDGTAVLEEDGTTITQDNVGGDITIACSPSSGSVFPLGDSLVQCSARDATGNFVRGSFTVTVNSQPPPPDTTRPVITVPEDITVEAASPDGATVSFQVSAQDDEDGPTDVTCDHNSGETFPIGETVVTCSAEDLVGNKADEKSFTITVQDTTAPDVEITKAVDRRNNREVVDGSTTPTPYIRITFQATDIVGIDRTECSLDGQQPFTSCTSPVIYDRLSRGTHLFTVRATDAAGNTGEDQFRWTVNPAVATQTR